MTKKTSKVAAGKKSKKPSGKKNIKIEDQDTKESSRKRKEKKDNASAKKKVKAEEPEVTTEEKQDTSGEERNSAEDANEKAKEWHDKYLRLSAEFDNYRKRTLKERSELIKSANEDLLVDILKVVDDFDRGLDHIDKSEDLVALKEGIHLIHGKFEEFLKQKGIKEIEAAEQEFDLDYHEAMTKIPAPSEELKGKVVDVIEKGYMLNDKVIRYAKVVVGD